MDAKELFEQLKDIVKNGDFDQAKTLLEENKDNLGEYFEQAKQLLNNTEGLDGVLDKVKGIFGK
ncbi:hypothetical protein [Streptococcus moroccensis]|uniref:ABC-type transporter Mla subunit MlaD n=1 Tax=Streptococcus moroccensis TaxID=1451356 RepID=A0ABT9YSC0_9STRE|nr:hypothetical protein [Streptococcus moroccensis]MDQ0222517.1 ABC-type transporter Mla subunit MlaD [Streptococcus moroccensis]